MRIEFVHEVLVWKVATTVVLLLCCSTSLGVAAQGAEGKLTWEFCRDPLALCNDFTRAGFFHRPPTTATGKWVIVLESGSFCYTNETCNRRYFHSSVREKHSSQGGQLANAGFGDFDPFFAWSDAQTSQLEAGDHDWLMQTVNPLMTSLSCFNGSDALPDLTLEGKDLLSTHDSPFGGHGQVVVPYCSSDLWLGSEDGESRDFPRKVSDNEYCKCWDTNCFSFQPNYPGLQFTFRGKTIFQSALNTLLEIYSLRETDMQEIVLVGSSAGGLGVLNLAQWVREKFPEAVVRAVVDSSWFVNFRNGINNAFTVLDIETKDDEVSTSFSFSSTFTASISPSAASPSAFSSIINSSSTLSHLSTSSSLFSASDPSPTLLPSQTVSTSTSSSLVAPSPSPALNPSLPLSSLYPSPSSLHSSPSSLHSSPSSLHSSPSSLPDEGSTDYSGSGSSGNEERIERNAFLEEFVSRADLRKKRSQDASEAGSTLSDDLLSILHTHDACYDTSWGFPCCLSAQCLLSEKITSTGKTYFPTDVPLFVVTSLYDIFILAPALSDVISKSSGQSDFSRLGNFLTTVGEFSGAMNSSMDDIEIRGVVSISLYVTQCFQHIYLATSSLWGKGSLFGTSTVEFDPFIATFKQSIQPGISNTNQLAYKVHTNQPYTIMAAIGDWYENGTATYRDVCNRPYCNEQCPEQFIFNEMDFKEWPWVVRIAIASFIVAVGVVCLFIKFCFVLWLRWVEKKQSLYLRSIEDQEEREEMLPGYIDDDLKRVFPNCNDDQAISVACFDLHYSVTTRVGQHLKDEKKDNLTLIALTDLRPEEELNTARGGSQAVNRNEEDEEEEEEEDEYVSRTYRNSVSSENHAGALHRIKKALTPGSGIYRVPTFRNEGENLNTSIQQSNGHTPFLSHGRTSRESNFSQDTFDEESYGRNCCGSFLQKAVQMKRKKILKGISVYFNPGELIGIMGPSGCGKTTFLDILTGRRKTGMFSGQIFINGIPMEENLNWYVNNTGYVIQLATPYYGELTVRENLTLAAWIKLQDSIREKYQRVEQVMDVTGLLDLADTVVGGTTGPGLSGGQKRRLAIAMQLLKLPSVIFLDEPTSGLDAASSRELLAHLNDLAASNRTVVLTIHQPRLEIFHLFHRLVLLSDGKVAYHGVPEKAYEVFVNALRSGYLQQRLVIPDLEDRNPADVIMDMLGNQKMRQLITDYYQSTDEPKLVRKAVVKARIKERSLSIDLMDGPAMKLPSMWEKLKFILHGPRHAGQTHNHTLARLAALEARASKRATLFIILYLPVIFFAYGFLLGTVYFQQTSPLLIMSGFCVYSVASALFMFPALYTYYQKALDIYSFEHADGIGKAQDLVIQPFIRFIAMAAGPVVVCAWILYMLLVEYSRWDLKVFGQVVVVNLALNQTWTALLIWLILTFPTIAFRLSPVLSAVAGFTSGFFIPIEQIPWPYRWLCYINPNYYGFSASAVLLLNDFETECEKDSGSEFECYSSSGQFVLASFDFEDINPYQNIVILIGMTVFFLLLACVSNWWNHTTLQRGMKKVILVARKLSRAASLDTSSLFSVSLVGLGNDSDLSDDGMSTADELEEREDFLDPKDTLTTEERPDVHSPLSPISEKFEDLTSAEEGNYEARAHGGWDDKRSGASTWEYPMRYPQNAAQEARLLPTTSLPEIGSAVSPLPEEPVTPHTKARRNWQKALQGTLEKRQASYEMMNHHTSIEMENFAVSAPQSPTHGQKHVMFEDAINQSSGGNNFRSVRGRRTQRKRATRSVYLRDGEIHSVWKPSNRQAASSNVLVTSPSPPPGSSFADVVQAAMKKHDLLERQRKLFSRVTATQAVLREQNEELAIVDEDEEEDEDEDKRHEKPAISTDIRMDTPTRRKWRKAIKSVMDDNKDTDSITKRRERKRSTLHFHKVVTNKMASMDNQSGNATRFRSTSDNGGASPSPISPKGAQKPNQRKASLPRARRAGAITPSGAIPFTQWKTQYYQRQRLGRQDAMRHCHTDYNLIPRVSHLSRIYSDDNIHIPGRRISSINRADDMEPRSKSVSQTHYGRRRSSPEILLEDDLSDTSMPLDDILSPISSRSISPAVFSDEEERRSKLMMRTPVEGGQEDMKVNPNPPAASPLRKHTTTPSSPAPLRNVKKRIPLHQIHRKLTVIEADSEPEMDTVEFITPRGKNFGVSPRAPQMQSRVQGTHRRPKRVSLSLPTSPRETPSPQPTSPVLSPYDPPSRQGTPQHQAEMTITSPTALNERISQEQSRRDSQQHMASAVIYPENGILGDYSSRSRSVTPDEAPHPYYSRHPPTYRSAQGRGSSPLKSSELKKKRKISSPTPHQALEGVNISQARGPLRGKKITVTSPASGRTTPTSGRGQNRSPTAMQIPQTRV